MSVDAQQAFWPEREEEVEKGRSDLPRIAQIRHRVGDFDVTRLIFDSKKEATKADGA